MSNSLHSTHFEAAAAPTLKRKRPSPLSVRLSNEEKAWLKTQADGGSVHGLARERILRDFLPRPRSLQTVDRAAIAQALAKLGGSHLSSNMNQIAKAANSGRLPVDADLCRELHQACADIRAMRLALTKALGIKPKD